MWRISKRRHATGSVTWATNNNMQQTFTQHLQKLNGLCANAEANFKDGSMADMDEALQWAIDTIAGVQNNKAKVMFIGNGGSAAIASHMAIDFTRNGGVAAMAFNDAAALTCYGNDFGYEQVFAKQVALQARDSDLLVAISSSGASANILTAVDAGRDAGCSILTLSGFSADNPLRHLGDMNLYVPNDHYGQVEVVHLVLCHALLDLSGGWGG